MTFDIVIASVCHFTLTFLALGGCYAWGYSKGRNSK